MSIVKILFPFIFAGILFSAQAQTQEIAHKSHSGKTTTMYMEPQGNLGEVESKLIRIKRISNSKLVFTNKAFDEYNDTVNVNTSKNRLQLVYDSLKAIHPEVEYLNFKKAAKPQKNKNTSNLEVPFLLGSASLLAILLMWYYKRDLTSTIG